MQWIRGAIATGTLMATALLSQSVSAEVITGDTAQASNVGLYGGQAEDLAVDGTSDAVYMAAFAPSGLFTSLDDGLTWTGLPSTTNYGNGKAVEVDQATGIAFAVVGDTLLRTSDQGTTWEELSLSDSGHPGNAFLFAHDRLFVSDMSGGVYVSEDKGETFTNYPIANDLNAVWFFAATNTPTVYAIMSDRTNDYLYVSTDGGATWTDMDVVSYGVAEGARFSSAAVNPTDDLHIVTATDVPGNSIYQTTDGGATWSVVTGDGDTMVSGNYVAFNAAGRLYVSKNYSDNPTDESPVWETVFNDTPASSIFADVVVTDPTNDSVVFTNSAMTIARSTDGGLSWTDSYEGITSVRIYDISQATDLNTVWMSANGGLAHSSNFTEETPTWNYPILPLPGASNIHAVWVNPEDTNVVLAGLSTTINKSIDGGANWTTVTAPAFEGNICDIVADPDTSSTLYAINCNDDLTGPDSGGVFMTTDMGDTWTDLSVPGNVSVISLAVSETGMVYAGMGGDAEVNYVYAYDGSSWSELSGDFTGSDITTLVVNPNDPDTLYLTSDHLYISTDAGATWELFGEGLEMVNNLRSLTIQTTTTPLTMYVTGMDMSTQDGVIYKSSDEGKTWSLYYTGLRNETFYSLLFDALIAGNDRGAYSIKTKATLGVTVKRVENRLRNVTLRLRDSATGKKLAHKYVVVYKKVQGGTWERVKRVKTNKNGVVHLTRKFSAGVKIKAVWNPKTQDAREYQVATSRIVKLK